jgi:hypothetical protein
MKSSPFEGILLKATWPDDNPVPSEIVKDLVKYSIPAFKYTYHVSLLLCRLFFRCFLPLLYVRQNSDEDPYYMTLHKLWTKMTEKDWRIVTKSLYILHCISRESSKESCSHFADAMK